MINTYTRVLESAQEGMLFWVRAYIIQVTYTIFFGGKGGPYYKCTKTLFLSMKAPISGFRALG